MSYIKIEIGGKERGFKFNQMAVEVFSKNIQLDAIGTSSVYATFYAGLTGNAYAKKEDIDFTFEDVVNWVDELYDNNKLDLIKQVNDCFSETQAFKSLLENLKEQVEEVKKKGV